MFRCMIFVFVTISGFGAELLASDKGIALKCSNLHPGKHRQHSVLFLLDRNENSLRESSYCGSWKDIDLVLGLDDQKKYVWFSKSPYSINSYGEKMLDLNKMTFEYTPTWFYSYSIDKNKTELKRSTANIWSAQCVVIPREMAIEIEKKLIC